MNKELLATTLEMLGFEYLGTGASRVVFGNGEIVVKIAVDNNTEYLDNIYNYNEVCLWTASEHNPEMRQWLAPILKWSPDYSVIVMAQTESITKEQLEVQDLTIPEVLLDFCSDNWGSYEGKLVCHDYGHTDVYRMAAERVQYVKAPRPLS